MSKSLWAKKQRLGIYKNLLFEILIADATIYICLYLNGLFRIHVQATRLVSGDDIRYPYLGDILPELKKEDEGNVWYPYSEPGTINARANAVIAAIRTLQPTYKFTKELKLNKEKYNYKLTI